MQWMILPLRRYADFQGRSRRKEYWLYSLLIILLYIVLLTILFAVAGTQLMTMGAGQTDPEALIRLFATLGPILGIMGIVYLALLVPSIAVGVRRLHDIDRTGWWVALPTGLSLVQILVSFAFAVGGVGSTGAIVSLILSLASLAASVVVLVFTVLDGTRGPNRFGPDPKGTGDDLVTVFR